MFARAFRSGLVAAAVAFMSGCGTRIDGVYVGVGHEHAQLEMADPAFVEDRGGMQDSVTLRHPNADHVEIQFGSCRFTSATRVTTGAAHLDFLDPTARCAIQVHGTTYTIRSPLVAADLDGRGSLTVTASGTSESATDTLVHASWGYTFQGQLRR